MTRVAIITHGGIAGGLFNQGIPALVDLFDRLSERFALTAYQSANFSPDDALARKYPVRRFALRAFGIDLIARLIRDHLHERYSLVHGLWAGGGLLAARAARILRIPAVVSLLGGETACIPEIPYGGLLSEKSVRRLKRTCGRCDAITVGSRYQEQKLREICNVRVNTIPLGADSNLFQFRGAELKPPFRFLHVANLTEVKDQRMLIQAYALIRKEVAGHLTIVGPDYLNGELQAVVRRLGLDRDVTFVGAVPHADLPAYFQESHILLHSSLYESQAVVAVEAMSCGTVVCGTAVGILADLKDEHCLVVEPRDAPGLARIVLGILRDSNRYGNLRRSAREWATAYSAQWTAARFMDLYESLVH
jgi:glycosyltransferase involved in cell wall biosynthesis